MSEVRRKMAATSNRPAESRTGTRAWTAADSKVTDTDRESLDALIRRNEELVRSRLQLIQKVTELRAALKKAHRYSHYDELTGLPNRRLLLDRFTQAAALASRNRRLLAILFLDLDDFKHVNDSLGHEAGDKLLQKIARRLSSIIRKSDTACRLGGDEFVILLTELDHREQAESKMNDIREHLLRRYTVAGESIQQAASTGLAVFPDDSEDFNELMRLSDKSMFRNKPGRRTRPVSTEESGIRRYKRRVATSMR